MMDLQVARSYRSFGMRMSKNVARVNVVQFSLKLRIKKKKDRNRRRNLLDKILLYRLIEKIESIRECKWIDLLIQ